MTMFETFDHTADLGLRIVAPNFQLLLEEAGRGLFSLIVEDLSSIHETSEFQFTISGEDREYLLFDFLRELLYRFDAEQQLASRFEVTLLPTGLSCRAWGECLEPSRHALSHEVKAITYHGLSVQQLPDHWVAEVIVDI
jgi:SHS2 domain-containing protein